VTRVSDAPAEVTGGGDPTGSLWKGLAVLRFILLAYALAINLARWQRFDDPLVGWFVLTVIAVWTLVVTWAYDAPRRRRWPLLAADLGVAVGALLVTPYVLSDEMLARHDFTLPTYWVTAPVLAWAIHRGWVGGVLAGLVIVPVDLGTRAIITATTVSNMFLLLLAAAVVGYTSLHVRAAAAERARATELAARTAERERLARAVHDGVLQVLAYVQRRGMEIGGETAELARAAGEQEQLLRNLIRGQSEATDSAGGQVDLAQRLASLGTGDVMVATPAEPVLVPASLAEELVAAVRAGLDNVERHAPGAKAYVLLEHDDDRIVVSLRDDGPGIPPGRLEEAEAAGRMGVSRSIVGRLADLGGSATLTTAPGKGTEWELVVPHPEVTRRRRHEPA
jgi:signal transduction histidine kinase